MFPESGFSTINSGDVQVNVTKADAVNPALVVGSVASTVTVIAEQPLLSNRIKCAREVITGEMTTSLPLVTHNYKQTIAPSPGVSSKVTNAGSLGRRDAGAGGAHGTNTAGFSSAGTATNHNSKQSANDTSLQLIQFFELIGTLE